MASNSRAAAGAAACGLCLAIAATPAPAAQPIPDDARAAVREARHAAAARDFAALERLMVPGFVWSFGGDEDARQALAAWRAAPAMLDRLHRATGKACGFETADIVQCPARAGTGYRAGFRQTADGWKMIYFVAGD